MKTKTIYWLQDIDGHIVRVCDYLTAVHKKKEFEKETGVTWTIRYNSKRI